MAVCRQARSYNRHEFSLQPRSHFGSFRVVSKLSALCLLLLFVSTTRGQDQERKLIDRLLRPDMSLQSSEQTKKFVADKTLVDKQAHVSTFYLQKKSSSKDFSGTRDFSVQPARNQLISPAQGKTADISSRTRLPNTRYPTSPKPVRSANDPNKKKKTNDFSGNRPFFEQGKSQKSLTRQNPPLTIEQVRELLNKNK
jgi:hypothetical protein